MEIEESELMHGSKSATVWQEAGEEGMPEPALVIRTYSDGTLSITQDGSCVLLNAESMKQLTKLLNRFADDALKPNSE